MTPRNHPLDSLKSLFCFRWKEHDQDIGEQPTRQGFGTKLLTRLVPSDLKGSATLKFEPGGLMYELEASVERIVELEGISAKKAQAVVAITPRTSTA
jgi:hypothetical protein